VKTLRNFIFWSYERGSIQFDIMVTLIILFIFVAPRFIDFHDKPVNPVPLRSSEILVKEAGTVGNDARFIYEIRAEDLHGATTDDEINAALLRLIEPLSGAVTIENYKPVTDAHGKIIAYDATVLR
jgi:hypothetical protein